MSRHTQFFMPYYLASPKVIHFDVAGEINNEEKIDGSFEPVFINVLPYRDKSLTNHGEMFGVDLRWTLKCRQGNKQILSYIAEQVVVFYFDDAEVNFQQFEDVIRLAYFGVVFERDF